MRLFFFLFAALLALPVVWPHIDLRTSGLFYSPGQGFPLADNSFFVALHWLAYDGARVLGTAFAILAAATYFEQKRQSKEAVLTPKAWIFLLLALLIGPGLVANVGLKDHWGRARPREVTEFGGTATFSPALIPHFENAHSNGSFVAGDAAFGFFLPAFAYVVPPPKSRRVFWAAMGAGGLFGLARLVMGAHFFSDIVYAAFTMLLTTACVHAAMYGKRETANRWRGFFRASRP